MNEMDKYLHERGELWVNATEERTQRTHPELWDEKESIESTISEIQALRADLNRLEEFYQGERQKVITELGRVSIELK